MNASKSGLHGDHDGGDPRLFQRLSGGALERVAATDLLDHDVYPTKLTGFYIDIGASDSLGFQPTGIVNHNGRRTDTGYANDLLFLERLKGAELTLYQIGCPGETVQSILNPNVADNCYKLPETQMSNAISILQANQSEPGVVTIDSALTTFVSAWPPGGVNEACVATGVAAIGVDMPKIIKDLKAAAGRERSFRRRRLQRSLFGLLPRWPQRPGGRHRRRWTPSTV